MITHFRINPDRRYYSKVMRQNPKKLSSFVRNKKNLNFLIIIKLSLKHAITSVRFPLFVCLLEDYATVEECMVLNV